MIKSFLLFLLALPLLAQNLTVAGRTQAQASASKGMRPGIAESYFSLLNLGSTPTEATPEDLPVKLEPVSATVRHENWNDRQVGVRAKIRLPGKDFILGVQYTTGHIGKGLTFVLTKRF